MQRKRAECKTGNGKPLPVPCSRPKAAEATAEVQRIDQLLIELRFSYAATSRFFFFFFFFFF